MARTIKKHRVRSVSCQWASHLQRIFFVQGFRKHSAQCHNQSTLTTSFTALSQPKSTCCTACCLLESTAMHLCVFVCVRVSVAQRARGGLFRLRLRVCKPRRVTLCAGVECTQVLCVPLRTLVRSLCAEKREGDPREGMSEGREIPLLMKTSHTRLTLPPPHACTQRRIKQIDGPVRVQWQ